MKSYLNCPSCGRFITLEMVETSCQQCGADMCSRCLHKCSECGKEVCRDCWGGNNMCQQCNHAAGFFDGVSRAHKWENSAEGLIGTGKAIVKGVQWIKNDGRQKNQSRERAREREEARRRLMAEQHKQLYD